MAKPRIVPYKGYREFPEADMVDRAADFYHEMDRRRSVREFSERPVPDDVIRDCLRTAGTAPSGAHRQPWRFVVVRDPAVKRRIREAAEKEEHEFYHGRAPDDWLEALAPIGTDEHKPFLEKAPVLVVIFAEVHGVDERGGKIKNYYVPESVGIATGLLIAAVHHAGLASLTHTPSPMRFLNDILGRPSNERPFLLLVVGYPAPGVKVPDLRRKDLHEFATFV